MNGNVREWYLSEYSMDSFGDEIDTRLTWEELDIAIKRKHDINMLIGVEDSTIRERVMRELANRLDVSYDTVYSRWLKGWLGIC